MCYQSDERAKKARDVKQMEETDQGVLPLTCVVLGAFISEALTTKVRLESGSGPGSLRGVYMME